MFNLLRRISGSVIPRPDRPDDDPTSIAPKVGRKRRLSFDDDEDENLRKKVKEDTPILPPAEEAEVSCAVETAAVKEVTQGVREVDLDDKKDVEPQNVPLPEQQADELEQSPAPEGSISLTPCAHETILSAVAETPSDKHDVTAVAVDAETSVSTVIKDDESLISEPVQTEEQPVDLPTKSQDTNCGVKDAVTEDSPVDTLESEKEEQH